MPFKKGVKPKGAITFADDPSKINRNGRPRKLTSDVLRELKQAGIKPVSNDEIKDVYLSLLNTDLETLKNKAEEKETPVLIKVVIKAILKGKGLEIIEKMFDRALGKAVQQVEQNIKVEELQKPKNEDLTKKLGI